MNRDDVLRINPFIVLMFVFVFMSVQANADTHAASVVLSLGQNTAQLPEQTARVLKRKSQIFPQDLITTGAKGQLQLRFTDNSRLSLRPDTFFKVEEYQYTQSEPAKGKSVYRLLKGGLRTITGAISDENVDNYQIQTPIATIGVRGTHYSLFYCDNACSETTGAKTGLYGYVLEGEIVVGNEDIQSSIIAGRYFFLGGNGESIRIQETPFDLFEQLEDLGPDLMSGTLNNSIPALDVNNSPTIKDVQLPITTPAPGSPPGSNYP